MTGAKHWHPPARPEWVARINEEGRLLATPGLIPLDERSLVEAATANIGLDDFGAEDWREPFRILLRSLEEDAELNLTGRLRMRAELIQLLEARLRIEDTYRRHPEIDDEQIVKPIIVAGQGRCGSSFLNNMLAAHPEDEALLHWEAVLPVPPPEKASYATDPRIALADGRVTLWNRVTPTVTSIHEFGALLPIEDCQILALNFMSAEWFGVLAQPAAYQAHIASIDPAPAFAYHARVLKLLQWRNPRRHWVLKENSYLFRLPALLAAYPDACIVWPHRDPVRALASTISALGTFQWGGTDHPLKGGMLDHLTDPAMMAAGIDMAIDQIEAGAVPADRIHHLHYLDLVGDTMGTIAALYAHFDIPFDEAARQAMALYLARNPREARPKHRLDITPEDLGASRAAFARYQSFFGIADE